MSNEIPFSTFILGAAESQGALDEMNAIQELSYQSSISDDLGCAATRPTPNSNNKVKS